MESALSHLECTKCGQTYDSAELHTVCHECGKVLFARYDYDRARASLTLNSVNGRPSNLWRFAEMMPVRNPQNRISLGEGGTPVLPVPAYGNQVGLSNLWVKDEARNPTGSFKSRGLAAAVSRAKELGVTAIAMPSAGNAASALSAYAARANIDAIVFMPKDTPEIFVKECAAYGARVFLVDGLISDAGVVVKAYRDCYGWFDVSTLKEPYRVEGKKTMGYELAEEFSWRLPDYIIYPTGGGTGIIGMWKAFSELNEIGLINGKRPKMIAVQAEGCKPIVAAWEAGLHYAPEHANAATIAPGIRVPSAIGDYLILAAIRESGGQAISVSDDEILEATRTVAKADGYYFSPEVGACFAAARKLRARNELSESDEIVVFGTGSGLKHTDLIDLDPVQLDPDSADLGPLLAEAIKA